MAKRKIKVLYFLNGPSTTEDDEAAIGQFSALHNVCLRNAQYIGDNDAIEDFDIVAGHVPSSYVAAAEEKGEPPIVALPKTPIESVQAGSPLAPAGDAQDDAGAGDAASGAGDAGQPASGQETAPVEPAKDDGKGNAKPKAPEAKPDAAKGWRPNA
jgi:hypothetical protein